MKNYKTIDKQNKHKRKSSMKDFAAEIQIYSIRQFSPINIMEEDHIEWFVKTEVSGKQNFKWKMEMR